ncbi:AcrR family transcriptional regulator [Thermocatellispora tengchongensis]|uniref:AcrR family transcriptional regulator n=1 Tax=Thermocatellispora tengchongensis TaxID=1073253 RepID=A0A840P991_9ACTN|nr:TetR family transcriptional regulator [Thermocatellispora tengchongensis]MBB5135569.1 AcrR family transcriptional regulator [Thermocatellispora tengchongensis]
MAEAGPRRRRALDDRDRTARARIRDAAIERFAAHGVAATNLKDIAADAGVSTPLVIHHFGSKEGLRAACDEYVASVIKEQKSTSMAATTGKSLDPFQAVREAYEGTPIMRYLAKTIVDGSAHVDELVDEMIENSLLYMDEGVKSGLLTPTENPRERAVVLFLWQMGALVLHEQVERLLGIDLIDDTAGSAIKWARINADILAKGVINEQLYEKWRDAMVAAEQQSDNPPKQAKARDQETT